MDRFANDRFLVRKKVLQIFGGSFHIFDTAGQLLFYSQMKAFKLKEDIRLYTGEDMGTEVLTIKARQIVDFSAAYDVVDSQKQEKVGVLKRKGFKSVFRDEWIVMDANDREIGLIQEDSMALALLRRVINLIPQTYHGEINGTRVCKFQQNFNPFVMKITVDFSEDKRQLLDRRLGIAAAILLCAIEGKQE
jgi:uncharacterized protein YxjI